MGDVYIFFGVVAFICSAIGYSCLVVSGRISDKEDGA